MQTERIILETDARDAAKLRRAAEVLQGGGLVAFPTETVYGLGANAENRQAIERLYRVKQRPRRKPLAYHLGDFAASERLAAPLCRATRKLMRLYWPGPLTLVVPGIEGGLVGLRMPEHRVARFLLAATDAPVVATSANRSGGPHPASAHQVLDQLGGKIDLILDAGPLARSLPSTVVEVNGKWVRVLREGTVSAGEVVKAARMTMLFVCRGNTCRSPMAAALCRQELRRCGVEEVEVLSAGSAALGSECVSALAVQTMREVGLDLSGHRARPLTMELVDRADRIFVMERAQRRSILEMAPGAAGRMAMLDPSGRDIADPHGSSLADYNLCRGELAACIQDTLST